MVAALQIALIGQVLSLGQKVGINILLPLIPVCRGTPRNYVTRNFSKMRRSTLESRMDWDDLAARKALVMYDKQVGTSFTSRLTTPVETIPTTSALQVHRRRVGHNFPSYLPTRSIKGLSPRMPYADMPP